MYRIENHSTIKKIELVVERFVIYSNLILREGPHWLGCQFHNPIIWCPDEGHKAIYELPEGKTGHIFEILAKNHGFKPL